MRDETAGKVKRKDMPVFNSMISPVQLAISVAPQERERLFEGSSPVAREHFERDMARLKDSLAPARIEPKFAIASPDMIRQMPMSVDLRTGHIDARMLLPKNVRMTAPPAMPIGSADPEKTLSAAMKKVGHRK